MAAHNQSIWIVAIPFNDHYLDLFLFISSSLYPGNSEQNTEKAMPNRIKNNKKSNQANTSISQRWYDLVDCA